MTGERIECVAPTGDVCGEAATWSADENRIYWVDINRFLIHWMDLPTGAVFSRHFDEPVVALSLTDRPGVLLAALGSKLILFDVDSNERTDLGIAIPGSPDVRFNDGRTDPLGVFWISSMGNNVGPNGESHDIADGLGKLFRYKAGGRLESIEDGVGIGNTVCWAPDGKTLFFGDTMKNEIRAYPYNPETGDIGPGRPHFKGFDRGRPDGSTIDEDGFIWNCRYDGGCVVRVAPDGAVDRVIDMPATNITTCCFGGSDLSTLFITTASAMTPGSGQLAGSLFALQTDTRGLPENKFKT